jgi:signal transduction histidine kinase
VSGDRRNALAAAVADALGVGIWLVGSGGETLYRNVRLDGLAPGVGSLAELAGVLPGIPLLGYVQAVGAGGRAVEEPAVLLRAGDETRLVQLRVAAGPSELADSVLITLEEVSQRLRVERLRALAETTVALSHEINNPLAVLSGEIELIRRDGGVADDRVDALRSAVGRIADVMQRLRRLAEPLGAEYLPSRGVRMLDLGEVPAESNMAGQAMEGKRGGEDDQASQLDSAPDSNPTEEVA